MRPCRGSLGLRASFCKIRTAGVRIFVKAGSTWGVSTLSVRLLGSRAGKAEIWGGVHPGVPLGSPPGGTRVGVARGSRAVITGRARARVTARTRSRVIRAVRARSVSPPTGRARRQPWPRRASRGHGQGRGCPVSVTNQPWPGLDPLATHLRRGHSALAPSLRRAGGPPQRGPATPRPTGPTTHLTPGQPTQWTIPTLLATTA